MTTTCLIIALLSSWPLGPGQHPQRVGEHRADVAQHCRSEFTVNDSVVERERERANLTHGELAVHDPGGVLNLPDGEYRRLARRDDRRSGVHAEHADVSDRDRAA